MTIPRSRYCTAPSPEIQNESTSTARMKPLWKCSEHKSSNEKWPAALQM